MSSAAADLNVPAQKLQTEQWSSQPSTSAPIRDRLSPQAAPDPHISKKTPNKGELRLTSSRYPSGTKMTEEETGSNPYYSAATAVDPKTSRVWSAPPAVGPDC